MSQGTRRTSNADIQAAIDLADNFAQGSWTPTLDFTGGNGTATMVVNEAKYVKAGKMVTVTANVTIAKGTASGSLVMDGLPFVPNANYMGQMLTNTGNLAMPAQNFVKVRASGIGIEFVRVLISGSQEGLTALVASELPASVNFTMTFFYGVD